MAKAMADAAEQVMDGPIKKTVEKLLEEMEAAARPRIYNISVYSCELPFFYPENTQQIDLFQKGISRFVARMLNPKKLPEQYSQPLKIREFMISDFVNAYTIAYWSDPEQDGGKVTEPQALRMVGYQPGMCEGIVSVIQSAIMNGAVLVVTNNVLEAKKNSNPTTALNSDSKPQEPSTISTPRTSRRVKKSA